MINFGPYKYHYRRWLGSDKLLLEFISCVENDSFLMDILDALKSITPKITGYPEACMSDDIIYLIDSQNGKFTLSKSPWGHATIFADDNQDCISSINNILLEDIRFKKIEVNFNDYKK
jgi:hypothetical protein